jgi:hypothetical protein
MILLLNVKDAHTTLLLWFASNFPGYQASTFLIYISFALEAMLPINIDLLDDLGWDS